MFEQEDAANDYQTDAMLHELCQPDAESICKDVEPGEGRVQDCLVSQCSFQRFSCVGKAT